MKLQIFAVRDRKTDQFANPMFLISKGHAVRHFADEINRKDENNILWKHPEDFELYELGSYNTETGIFDTGTPTSVALAESLMIKA